MDELYLERKSDDRIFSPPTSKEADVETPHQQSIQRQGSGKEGKKPSLTKKTSLTKKEEEWDKEIPSVSLGRVIAVNAREWWLIILGVIGAFLAGSVTPIFAIVLGEILEVFTLPRAEIRSAIVLWAAIFLAMGVGSMIGIFLKVSPHQLCIYNVY